MRHFSYDHLGAFAILPVHERAEIERAIVACTVQPGRGAAGAIRASFLKHLAQDGWSDEFQVAPSSKITITSVKNSVGLCVQTGGNMARMYADLLKLQELYVEGRIRVGAFILPTAPASKDLGANVANADRLQGELAIFRKVIHIPIAVFSFQ